MGGVSKIPDQFSFIASIVALGDWKAILIAVLSFLAFFLQWNFVVVLVFAAVAGLLLRPKRTQTKAAPLAPFQRVKENEYPILV